MSLHYRKTFIRCNLNLAPHHSGGKRHAPLQQKPLQSMWFAMQACPDFFEMLPWICVPERKEAA